jgi:hypothetical protein
MACAACCHHSTKLSVPVLVIDGTGRQLNQRGVAASAYQGAANHLESVRDASLTGGAAEPDRHQLRALLVRQCCQRWVVLGQRTTRESP